MLGVQWLPVYVLDCTLLKKSVFGSNECRVLSVQCFISATLNLESIMIVVIDVFDHVRLREQFIYPVPTIVRQCRLRNVRRANPATSVYREEHSTKNAATTNTQLIVPPPPIHSICSFFMGEREGECI